MSRRTFNLPGGIAQRLLGQGAQAPKQDLDFAAAHIVDSLKGLGVNVTPGQAKQSLGGIPQLPGHGGCAIRTERPALRRRVNIPDIVVLDGAGGEGFTVSAGTGLMSALTGELDWDAAADRRFIHGEDSPRGSLDKAWKDLWLIEIDPICRAFVRAAGGGPDREMSQEVTEFLEMSHLVHIDPNGTGKSLKMDPTLVEDFPKGGVKLDRDQVFKLNKDSYVQFDPLGSNEADDYTLGDLAFDIDIVVTVFVGIKAVFADKNPFA